MPDAARCFWICRASCTVGRARGSKSLSRARISFAVAALPDCRDDFGRFLGSETAALGLAQLVKTWRSCRPRPALALNMGALRPCVPEFPLQFARHKFVLPKIMLDGNYPLVLPIGTAPDHMHVGTQRAVAVSLVVRHHNARLSVKAKLGFEPVNGPRQLLRRQFFMRRRVERGVIQALA
jgi:hypothetical protein